MKCSICGADTDVYKAKDGKAINLVVLENNVYCYCVRCLRRDMLLRLDAKIHPVINNGVNSRDIIEFAEAQLKKSNKFEAIV